MFVVTVLCALVLDIMFQIMDLGFVFACIFCFIIVNSWATFLFASSVTLIVVDKLVIVEISLLRVDIVALTPQIKFFASQIACHLFQLMQFYC